MAKQEEKKELVVKSEQSSALEALSADIAIDAIGGSGFETVRPEDVAIPFIRILQALSEQVRGSTKIPDATEGDFYNTVTGKVYKDHIVVIPCAYQKAYVEWVPRLAGGGFVKQHLDSAILEQTKKNEKNMDILANGHHIVATAFHYCLLLTGDGSFERAVLALASTQLKKSRRWLSQMMSLQILIGDRKVTPPMYSHTYTLTTVEESNEQGSWYGFSVGQPKLIDDKDLYLDAKKFYNDITAGLVKTTEPPGTEDSSARATVDTSNVADKF